MRVGSPYARPLLPPDFPPFMSRVLIIDDDPSMVQVISDICSQGGHMPIALNSGAKAIGMLAGHAPHQQVSDQKDYESNRCNVHGSNATKIAVGAHRPTGGDRVETRAHDVCHGWTVTVSPQVMMRCTVFGARRAAGS